MTTAAIGVVKFGQKKFGQPAALPQYKCNIFSL